MSGCSKLRGSTEPESHSVPMLIIRGSWNLLSSGWPLFSGQNFQPNESLISCRLSNFEAGYKRCEPAAVQENNRKADPRFISDESMVRLWSNTPRESRLNHRRITRSVAVRILLWASLLLPILALIFLLHTCR